MARPLSEALVSGGPGNNGSWYHGGRSTQVPSPGSMADAASAEAIVHVAPPAAYFSADGIEGRILGSDNIIQYLNAVYITPTDGNQASVANFNVQIRVYRAHALVNVGANYAAGWVSVPAITQWQPTLMPWNTARTDLTAGLGRTVTSGTTQGANVGLLPLQPLDVVTLFLHNATGGAITPQAFHVQVLTD